MVARLLIAAGLMGLAAITASRVPVWADDRELWAAAVSVTPGRPRALLNLTHAELGTETADYPTCLRRIAEARIALRDARRWHRRGEWLLVADINEARALLALHRNDDAKDVIAAMLRREPDFVPALRMARWVE